MADAMADALGSVNIETIQTERARQYIEEQRRIHLQPQSIQVTDQQGYMADVTSTLRPGASFFTPLVSAASCTPHASMLLKPGVHTNDFAPIYGRRAKKLGHASLATVFRHGRLTFQPILLENLESPVLRYQPITTAVITDACLNTRWHHGA